MNEWMMNDGPWLPPGSVAVRGEAHLAGKLADLLVAAHDLVLAARGDPLPPPHHGDAIEAYARRVCDEVSDLLRGVGGSG